MFRVASSSAKKSVMFVRSWCTAPQPQCSSRGWGLRWGAANWAAVSLRSSSMVVIIPCSGRPGVGVFAT
jgi:hypothetical protein